MNDWSELKRLAEDASFGDWRADQLSVTADTRALVCCGRAHLECCGDPDVEGDEFDPVCTATAEPFAEFIAAANPGVILALIAENERLRQDAERYRWLRDLPRGAKHGGMHISICRARSAPNDWVLDNVRGELMDASIDFAMKEGRDG